MLTIRELEVSLAIVLATAGGLVGCGGTESALTTRAEGAAAAAITPTQLRLASIAGELARGNGDGTAQGRTAVLTTLGVARRLLDDEIEPEHADRPVYLLWMYGNFRRNHAGRPFGNLLIGSVDAKTMALEYADVPAGELNPSTPSPEKLRLPRIPLVGDVQAPPPDDVALDRIRDIAREAAQGNGESAPTAEYYATNDQSAERALGNSASGNPDRAAYLIVMHGRFEQNHSMPAGVTAPPTPLLVLELAADDLAVLTIGWAQNGPDTDDLGEPLPLLSR